MARQRQSKVELYRRRLRPLMEHVHGRTFAEDHVFTQDELLAVTPENMVAYIKIQVYDNEDADPDIDPPVHFRSNTVKFWKKAWSYFMVNRSMPWNEVARVGNPTRSHNILTLIRSMKRMEVQRRGKPSQARRAFVAAEYENAIEYFTHNSDKEVGIWLAAYFSTQLNLIARLDDTAKFRLPELQPYHQFPNYGVTGRLCWSKAVMEERDAPRQLLVGAQDWRYCVLSNMAQWLEYHFTLNPEPNEYVFGIAGMDDPISIKGSASYHLRQLLRGNDFIHLVEGITGSHSLRKLGVNIARGNGCNKDDTDTRARWKGAARQQDTYADTTIPFVDAKVAAALCKGGPVAYVVKTDSGIDDTWVLDYVTPAMKDHVPRQVAIVLGRALLWKVFHDESGAYVPAQIRERVLAAYRDLGDRNSLAAGSNPVSKVPLGITGLDAEVIIDEIMVPGDGNGDDANPQARDYRVSRGMERQEVRLLQSQVLHLRRELADMRAESERRDVQMKHTLTRLNRNVARLVATPGRRHVDGGRGGDTTSRPGEPAGRTIVASLVARPSTLHDLWQEYEFGGAGRKAAKYFNASERGAVKSVYSFRLVFWQKCSEMIRSGMTADVACDRIYKAYGENTSVTTILRNMKRDKRNGWPPLLECFVRT